jgi:hypothetical protein
MGLILHLQERVQRSDACGAKSEANHRRPKLVPWSWYSTAPEARPENGSELRFFQGAQKGFDSGSPVWRFGCSPCHGERIWWLKVFRPLHGPFRTAKEDAFRMARNRDKSFVYNMMRDTEKPKL